VEHAPSPQRCATLGGVWDDTEAATDKETGGKCLSPGRAEGRLDELGSTAEVVEVELSHDQQSECWLLEISVLACMCMSVCLQCGCNLEQGVLQLTHAGMPAVLHVLPGVVLRTMYLLPAGRAGCRSHACTSALYTAPVVLRQNSEVVLL
jgi:hypothetical protein